MFFRRPRMFLVLLLSATVAVALPSNYNGQPGIGLQEITQDTLNSPSSVDHSGHAPNLGANKKVLYSNAEHKTLGHNVNSNNNHSGIDGITDDENFEVNSTRVKVVINNNEIETIDHVYVDELDNPELIVEKLDENTKLTDDRLQVITDVLKQIHQALGGNDGITTPDTNEELSSTSANSNITESFTDIPSEAELTTTADDMTSTHDELTTTATLDESSTGETSDTPSLTESATDYTTKLAESSSADQTTSELSIPSTQEEIETSVFPENTTEYITNTELFEATTEESRTNTSIIIFTTENATPEPSTTLTPSLAQDCAELYLQGERSNAIYVITLPYVQKTFNVFCEMNTNRGGWTVLQRRGDYGNPVDYFARNWDEYKNGFGELDKEFWLGNDHLSMLTQNKDYILRVDLWDKARQRTFAQYSTFKVGNEQQLYRLSIGGYFGNAGDSMTPSLDQDENLNQMAFTTKDRQNDRSRKGNCAALLGGQGGWWYNDCFAANLNGRNLPGKSFDWSGIVWRYWGNTMRSLAFTEMKIRPVHF